MTNDVTSNKILVVDDSRVIRLRIKEMLPPGNFAFLEAKDGLEGLKLIVQERPNLIMLDFLLPKLSGWEVFQEIQKSSNLQKIPLVLMSGRKEEVIEKIQEPFTYFEFILKPFEQKELVVAIKSAMTKAKQPRQEAIVQTKQIAALPAASEVDAEADVIQVLNDKIARMQLEINELKNTTHQLKTFMQQKSK